MSTSDRNDDIPKVLGWLLILVSVGVIVFNAVNHRSGPPAKVEGVILTTRLKSLTEPTIQIVTVRLRSGEVVQAMTRRGVVASVDDRAFAHAYKHAWSGASSYEIVRVERPR